MNDLSQLRAYYDETWRDYRILWLNPRNRAIHFGYFDVGTRGHSESLINMNRVLARRLGLRPGERVLDAGCGVGGSAIWLAKEYGAEVVGITPVASQVDRARRYAREHGVADRIRFEQQDYTATTFAAESFDVVWALESFCHEPEKPRILVEARRLLRPGGRLGAAEYMRRCERYPAPDERLLETWLSGWAIPSLATAKQWLTWTTSNGFVDAQVLDVTQNVLPSLRRLYWITVFLWPLTIVLRAIRVRSKAQQGNVRGALQQYRALQRDLWGYGLLTATAPPS